MSTGKPSISDPRTFDIRAFQAAVSNVRQRIEALDAAVAALQAVTGSAANITALQAQVNAIVRANGTVTRVAATVPDIMTLAGSPITTAGTLEFDLADQPAGLVLAGPISGVDAKPSFRALHWNFDAPPFTSVSFTSGLSGDEAVLIELYGGGFFWTTTGAIAALASAATGVALLAANNVFTKAQTVTPVALTDAATVAMDGNLSNTFTLLMTAGVGATRVLGNPTNLRNGCIYNLRTTQSSGGSNALTYGSKFKFSGGSPPALSTAANAVDHLSFQYFSDSDTLLGVLAIRGAA